MNPPPGGAREDKTPQRTLPYLLFADCDEFIRRMEEYQAKLPYDPEALPLDKRRKDRL